MVELPWCFVDACPVELVRRGSMLRNVPKVIILPPPPYDLRYIPELKGLGLSATVPATDSGVALAAPNP